MPHTCPYQSNTNQPILFTGNFETIENRLSQGNHMSHKFPAIRYMRFTGNTLSLKVVSLLLIIETYPDLLPGDGGSWCVSSASP